MVAGVSYFLTIPASASLASIMNRKSLAMIAGVLLASTLGLVIWSGVIEIADLKPKDENNGPPPRIGSSPGCWRCSRSTSGWGGARRRSRSG